MGFFGADVHLDVLEIGKTLEDWSWKDPENYGELALNVLAFLPVVGIGKYGDEIGEVASVAGKKIDKFIKNGFAIICKKR